jgi:hypothetical protein
MHDNDERIDYGDGDNEGFSQEHDVFAEKEMIEAEEDISLTQEVNNMEKECEAEVENKIMKEKEKKPRKRKILGKN